MLNTLAVIDVFLVNSVFLYIESETRNNKQARLTKSSVLAVVYAALLYQTRKPLVGDLTDYTKAK